MELFAKQNFVEAVKLIHELMVKNKDYLIELDSSIGDGDLGLTMVKGFTAAAETAETCQDTDIGVLFKRVGFAISKAAPSTMGSLMATAFIGAGKAVGRSIRPERGADRPLFPRDGGICQCKRQSKRRGKNASGRAFPCGSCTRSC